MIKSSLYTVVVILTAFLLMSQACEKKNQDEGTEAVLPSDLETEDEMEMLSYTFTGSYDDLWGRVEAFENQGLYKSALGVVDTIFTAARRDKNAPQIVKSVIFRMKYNSYLEEEDFVMALAELNALSEEEHFPIKQLIHSVTADVYWQYYSGNRYSIFNRTQTVNFDNNDVRTWDLKTISAHVYKHYMLSLEAADSSQHTSMNDFEAILSGTSNARELRPTLYDFLAYRAIDFFSNSESEAVRPEVKFVIDDEAYFGSASTFIALNPTSQTENSNIFHAVKIYQELTKFHLKDQNPAALIDAELHRLDFVYANSVSPEKGELYLKALQRLSALYPNHEGNAEINFKIATYYKNRSSDYSLENPEHRWDKKEAARICREMIGRFENTYGGKQCAVLLNEIQLKNLTFENELAYAKTENGKFKINYQNVDSVYFRIVQLPADYGIKMSYYDEAEIDALVAKTPLKEWSHRLENPGDHQAHSTELLLPTLPYGQYAILASSSKSFSRHKNIVLYDLYWVSDLSYTRTENADQSMQLFVTDRASGKPLNKVKVQLFERTYNYMTRRHDVKLRQTLFTDKNGKLIIAAKSRYRNFMLHLVKGEDEFNTGSDLYQDRKFPEKTYSSTATELFIDRGIYRPGQKIYFKGIKIKSVGEKHSLVTNSKSTVTLYDANYQKVGEVELTTNEYGTFAGSFTAPTTGLTGMMHISTENGSKYFSVEEYKRPKFEVDFLPVEGAFKIGERISVKGNAKAYAGSTIDGATVQYRVTRSCNFNPWTSYRWGYYPYSAPIEIKNGTATTDENGAFTIEFDALEDRTINKKFSPRYSYQVHADVTDVNGETRSGSQYVSVGYECMNLTLSMDSKFERTASNQFALSSTNLNGQKVSAKGMVNVTALIEPEQTFRTQVWRRPDLPTISETEYRSLFPHDPYTNEDDVKNFKRGKKVLTLNFDTEKSDTVTFAGMNAWKPGRYVVETSAIDAFGETVEHIQYITILDKTLTENPTNELWTMTPLKSMCEPGETAEILLATAAEGLSILYEIEVKGKIVATQMITLSKGQKVIQIPITEAHRGNISVIFTSVKNGRLYSTKQVIIVPFSNKELNISFETFRNKLDPGAPEEWKLIIKGPNGAKVAAELLATMYDASLDEFSSNSFYLNPYTSNYSYRGYSTDGFGSQSSRVFGQEWNTYPYAEYRTYDQLNWWGYYYYSYRANNYYYNAGGLDMMDGNMPSSIQLSEVTVSKNINRLESIGRKKESREYDESESMPLGDSSPPPSPMKDGNDVDTRQQGSLGNVKARTNLNETAFFYPQMETNANGEIVLKFTAPEALTRWKFLGLAHTKDLKIGTIQQEVVTQKELMVMPNAPRFFREGDQMTFTAKVSNLAETDLSGTAQLMLFDAKTMKPVDAEFGNANAITTFEAKKGQSAKLAWDISIPNTYSTVVYRVVAQAGTFSDGEEMAVPVLSNRMLVTESLPLPSKGIGTKNFTFTKLINSDESSSLKHHKLTLEYTSNPAWYAVQALPYMMEYPHECAEQTFSRYYANALASSIVNSNPKIKAIFEAWKDSDAEAFLSNLEKNQELKALIIEETPWVLDAQNEGERKKRIALLFDLNKMDRELDKALNKLMNMQLVNGAWSWFPGMRENHYITQHIVTGMGHLDNLGVKSVREDRRAWNMIERAVVIMDEAFLERFEEMKRIHPDYAERQQIDQSAIQYLYARSYFLDLPMNDQVKEAVAFYHTQAKEYWLTFDLYSQGMIALETKRFGVTELPEKIMASLKERSIVHEEMGMYWKENVSGYYWYQAPIETQALLIEAFDEITNDQVAVEELKVWLLKNKQTSDWKTTKATADACYALLLRGTDLLANDEQVQIKLDGKILDPKALGIKVEEGTGYFKTSWDAESIEPEMGNVSVTRTTEGVSWGAMYWQYFEDLDKITPHATPLTLKKQLFLVQNTDNGPVITPVVDGTSLKPGDKIRVRIELNSDRDMEYVHMKDMRAAGFEPINVLSRYKWQDGLGYYESTKDAATNFFMDYLPKGTYVFEYDLRVSHEGDFANGITTIQSMYAPEFTSHSEGVRVLVGE